MKYALLALAVIACSALPASAEYIFAIGVSDDSLSEFNTDFTGTPGNSPYTFTVGDPITTFPALVAGPDEEATGQVQPDEYNPLTIRFSLLNPVGAILLLDIYEMQNYFTTGPSIAFNITLNGNPVFSYSLDIQTNLGDDGLGPKLETEIPISASYFQSGTNDLVITVTDGDWIAFDSLALTRIPTPSTLVGLLGIGAVVLTISRVSRRRKP